MGMAEQGRCRQGSGWVGLHGLREHVAGLVTGTRDERERAWMKERENVSDLERGQTLMPFVISSELTGRVSCT